MWSIAQQPGQTIWSVSDMVDLGSPFPLAGSAESALALGICWAAPLRVRAIGEGYGHHQIPPCAEYLGHTAQCLLLLEQ